ncbi:tyrosine-protein phosphatase [Breznakia pachnodae]|uniref:protein-tyrosine-phosphatase n=1 Tax=Breznakia pachnodae TaxID=265178 RepID=A0ABU0DXD0_9FIRM|nr:CpsB/CapC family capsule biosynthesis tyrosine phosphatase [Breznakia pachnodae]MDQ0359296.1 protein-tyrosine phosphatase [Breznakia pachnodae]
MIDSHCHILWGVDDASATASQSLDMLRAAVKDGVETIVATSHIKHPLYPNTLETLSIALDKLHQLIKDYDLPITVVIGAENFFNHRTIELLEKNQFVTYNNANKYMLVEFSWTKNSMDNPTEYLRQVIAKGITPVVAHPERYEWVHDDYDIIRTWRKMGCLMQVNRTSILQLDKMKQANIFALKLLEDDLVDIIGSDAHRATPTRNPVLSDVYDYVSKHYGKERADLYININPKKIIKK